MRIAADNKLIITATASFPDSRGSNMHMNRAMYEPCRTSYCVRNMHDGAVIRVLQNNESTFSWGFCPSDHT